MVYYTPLTLVLGCYTVSMKKQQLYDRSAGFSDNRLWPFYVVYSLASLLAIMGAHGFEWLVVINVVAVFLAVRVARWERKTFRYSASWVKTGSGSWSGEHYEFTRTRIVPKVEKVPAERAEAPRLRRQIAAS